MERRLEDLFAELDRVLTLRDAGQTGWRVRCDHVNAHNVNQQPLFVVCDKHEVELCRSTTLHGAVQEAITVLREQARRMAQCL